MSHQIPPPPLNGIDHIKLPSADITSTHEFYTKVMGFSKMPHLDHRTAEGELFAVICQHEPTRLLVEIRYNPKQALQQRRWDPITWNVETRDDLEMWADWFDKHDIKHSELFTGMKSWLLAAEDPDGRFVKLMTKEQHEWTTEYSVDEYWLGNRH